MNRPIGVLSCALVLSLAHAQQPEVREAWTQFQLANGPQWTARWSPATGTPEAIFGTGLRLPGRVDTIEQARVHAAAVLQRHAVLLGTGNSVWIETIGQKVNQLHVLVYDQYFGGLQVVSGRADVRIHEIGVVAMFGSQALAIPANFNLVPTLTAPEAVGRAYEHRAVELPKPDLFRPLGAPARLVIHGNTEQLVPTAPRLAYEVYVNDPGQKQSGWVWIDAQNGRVLGFRTDYHECGFSRNASKASEPVAEAAEQALRYEVTYGTPAASPAPLVDVSGNVMAWVNTSIMPLAPLVNVPLQGLRVSIQGGGFAHTDVNGNFTIAHGGSAPVMLTVAWSGAKRMTNVVAVQGVALNLNVPATPGVPVNVQVFTSGAAQFDRAQTTAYWLINEVNEWSRSLIGGMATTMETINVRVNVASSCNASYGSRQVNFYHAAGSCPNTAYSTVVQHEWGHGLDDAYGGITQTEGLSEGWGDILGLYHTNQPRLGPDFQGPGNDVRSGLNTRTRGSCTEVHCAGESWMGWAWDLYLGFSTKMGPIAGPAHAKRIVVPSIVANARNQTTAAMEVYLLDDNDGNLANGTPNCDVLNAASTRRNIPSPVTSCSSSTQPGTFTQYGTACTGSNGLFPSINAAGAPTVGLTFRIRLGNAFANAPCGLMLGSSNSTWGAISLPVDLGPIGADGCFLRVSPDLLVPGTASSTGQAFVDAAIPNDPSLVGSVVYGQWFVVDAGANLFGASLTQGAIIQIGN